MLISIGLMEKIPLSFMESCMASMTGTGDLIANLSYRGFRHARLHLQAPLCNWPSSLVGSPKLVKLFSFFLVLFFFFQAQGV